ncbi:bifunctional folylpolyglutamate synthase/dihydrofolate synthase [Bacteroidota bacterium]
MNKKEEILNKLFSLQRFGIKPGLERTVKLLEYTGNPHLRFPSIHVAGTNGKGSVCSMIASILMEAGYKVGLYTSPHLVRFNERIRINENELSDDEMVELAEKLLTGKEKWECTFFEITTVMAFEYFARNNVDIAVIETGMGGRFDSTNVLTPLVSIISNISHDHKEYLGNTLEEIAYEKAGIIKENTPVIITDNNKAIKQIFEQKAKEERAEMIYCHDFCSCEEHRYNPDFTQTISIKTLKNLYENISLSLAGSHQQQNLYGAICTIEIISGKFPVEQENVNNGLANIKKNTGIRGRIELLSDNPPIILDTGHNPGSMTKLIETLKLHRPDINNWNFVYGAMADKDIPEVLKIIKPVCDEIILTQPKIDRAIELNILSDYANKNNLRITHSFNNVSDAVKFAINSGKPTVITGSFYLAGEALPVMEKMLKV